MSIPKIVAVVLFWLILVSILHVSSCCAADENQAGQAIGKAEQDLGASYALTLEAEEAGANISTLKATLNTAGQYLSQSRRTFDASDYDGAFLLADTCSNMSLGVGDTAKRLKSEAIANRQTGLVGTIAFSSIGLALLAIAGLVGWRLFRKRFVKSILDKKPEVEVKSD